METPRWATASTSLDSLVFSTMSLESGGRQRGPRGLVDRREEPQVEVSYRGLSVSFGSSTPKATTLLGRVSRWWPPSKGTSKSSSSPTPTEPEHLRLSNVSGALQPGTLTLVLGGSGSGKSALLQALAGRLDPARAICGGEIRYNGLPQAHLLGKVLPHSVVYAAQQDAHHASLTVRETLEFARRCCRSADSSPFPRSERGEADHKLNGLMENDLGLASCADSLVGDELRRGVSGGERKRVTVGEMLLGDGHRVLLLDEVSTGLDSATAMDVVTTLRRMACDKRLTVAMALLQPAPELVSLFDDVLLLADGHLLFHGPVDAAIPHFRALCIACPLDMPLAEFLLDVGTDRQIQYEVAARGVRIHRDGTADHPPRAPDELAAAFRRSPLHAKTMTHLKTPSKFRDQWESTGCMPPAFKQGFWRSTWTVLGREMTLVRRNRAFLVGRSFVVVFMALLNGSLYYRVNHMDAQVLVGVLFSSSLFVALGQASQIPSRVTARRVFAKQRTAHFFRTKSFVTAQAAAQLPTAVLEAVVFGVAVYLLCDLAPDGASAGHQSGHLARFLMLLLVVQSALSALFSVIAAVSPNIQVASILSLLVVLVCILFGGFLLPVSAMPRVLQPLYWFNPIAWAIRGLAINQYGDDAYRVCQLDGVNYCERYGKDAGAYALSGFGLSSDTPTASIVAAAGFQLGFMVICLVVTGHALERYRCRLRVTPSRPAVSPLKTTQATPSMQKPTVNASSTLDSDKTSSFGLEMLGSNFSSSMKPAHSYSSKTNRGWDTDAASQSSMSSKTNRGRGVGFRSQLALSNCDTGTRGGRSSDVAVDIISSGTPEPYLEFALLEEAKVKRRLTDRVVDMARAAIRPNASPTDTPATLIAENVMPVTVAFRNLSYCIRGRDRGSSKYLLKGVNGFAQPRTLTALMGSSGAGKTTLLDVLAGRKTQGRIEGDILLNGIPVATKGTPASLAALRELTGYCEQADLLCETATCREAIAFSALLRRRRKHRRCIDFDEVVDGCLDVLGLTDIAHQQVRAMSPEQGKRTAIGVELVAGPSVLLLDEPTSGLDPPASKVVLDAMRHAASATGCTVICTIHQPSTELFLAFDKVFLLVRGGQVAFFGNVATGSGGELVSYFEAIDGIEQFPGHGANPAEWMLDVIGAGIQVGECGEHGSDQSAFRQQTTKTETQAERSGASPIINFPELFHASPEGQRLTAQLQREGVGIPSSGTTNRSLKSRSLGASRESALTQVRALLERSLLSSWRSRPALVSRIGANAVMAALLGAVFFGLKLETYTEVNAGAGLAFTSVGLVGMVAFNGAGPAASQARALFYREHASGAYATVWYIVAGSIAEVPVVAASTLLFTLVELPMTGLWPDSWGGMWRPLAYWLVLSLNALLQVAVAQLLVFALPTLEVAAVVGALYNSLSLSFTGFNPPARSIPSGYRWLYHAVPSRYSCALMMSTVFGASDCEEGSAATSVGCRRLEGDLPPTLTGVSTVHEMVETMYLAKADEATQDLMMAVLSYFVLRALAVLVLVRVNHQRE